MSFGPPQPNVTSDKRLSPREIGLRSLMGRRIAPSLSPEAKARREQSRYEKPRVYKRGDLDDSFDETPSPKSPLKRKSSGKKSPLKRKTSAKKKSPSKKSPGSVRFSALDAIDAGNGSPEGSGSAEKGRATTGARARGRRHVPPALADIPAAPRRRSVGLAPATPRTEASEDFEEVHPFRDEDAGLPPSPNASDATELMFQWREAVREAAEARAEAAELRASLRRAKQAHVDEKSRLVGEFQTQLHGLQASDGSSSGNLAKRAATVEAAAHAAAAPHEVILLTERLRLEAEELEAARAQVEEERETIRLRRTRMTQELQSRADEAVVQMQRLEQHYAEQNQALEKERQELEETRRELHEQQLKLDAAEAALARRQEEEDDRLLTLTRAKIHDEYRNRIETLQNQVRTERANAEKARTDVEILRARVDVLSEALDATNRSKSDPSSTTTSTKTPHHDAASKIQSVIRGHQTRRDGVEVDLQVPMNDITRGNFAEEAEEENFVEEAEEGNFEEEADDDKHPQNLEEETDDDKHPQNLEEETDDDKHPQNLEEETDDDKHPQNLEEETDDDKRPQNMEEPQPPRQVSRKPSFAEVLTSPAKPPPPPLTAISKEREELDEDARPRPPPPPPTPESKIDQQDLPPGMGLRAQSNPNMEDDFDDDEGDDDAFG